MTTQDTIGCNCLFLFYNTVLH